MKYTIDTVNKTIEIEEALIEEVEKLAKKYKKYRVISMINITYPYYPPYVPNYPYWEWQPISAPFYVTAPTLTTVGTDVIGVTTSNTLTIN